MLCFCPVEEIIDKDEFVLLYEAYRPSNLPFPHSAYEKFSLAIANKDPAECKADFRVEKMSETLLNNGRYKNTQSLIKLTELNNSSLNVLV